MTTTFIPIPAATVWSRCRGCGRMMYIVPHPSTGRPHPVTADPQAPYDAEVVANCRHPHAELKVEGRGVSHFADCPDAARFRKAKK